MAYDDSGWIDMRPPGGANGLHVRLGKRGDEWVITDLFVHAAELTSEMLRAVSVSRLDATLRLGGAHFGEQREWEQSGTTRESGTPFGAADEPSLDALRHRAEQASSDDPRDAARLPLTRPQGMTPEQFYPRVAAAYAEYAPHTNAPAKAIAAEAGVPITTAHRWIREARRRGFLPSARKGRAG